MSVWQCAPSAAPICGSEGELVSVSISVSPRDLEALLESLARVDFPINPQIYHADDHASEARTIVQFPAYSTGLPLVSTALAEGGFDPGAVRVRGMLDEIQSLLDHEPGRRYDNAG